MASIKQDGARWRAQVYVRGRRESRTCRTKAEAAAWALEREAVLSGAKAHAGTVGDVLRRYDTEVVPTHKGAKWEHVRLALLQRDALARVGLASLTADDISGWRERRLRAVTGASVRREMNLLASALETARREWRWISTNPCRDVRKPPAPPPRRRRVTADEVDRLTLAFGLGDGLRADTAMQRTGLAFLLALETAMRAGEIVGLTAATIHLDQRFVRLPRTKNGDVRDVPLTRRAVEILRLVPDGFDLNPGTRDALFRRARDAAGIENLHFHDSRAEAIWRLSKRLDVLQLAQAIGHRDINSLRLYYRATAAELATRLD